MQVTILGSSASHPALDDACSGYLVSEGRTRVLLDCGSGVLGKLQQHAQSAELDAIVVSHLHPDHFIDLVPLRYGLRYGVEGQRRISVHLPPGGVAHLRGIGEALSTTQPFFDAALDLHEYEPATALRVGTLEITPREVVHGIRSFAMQVDGGGRRLVHSSDTVVCEEVVEAARGADLLLAECTLGGGVPDHQPRTHMTAAEAGEVARRAGVGALVLTHFWYTADRDLAKREALATFGGPVSIARPHLELNV